MNVYEEMVKEAGIPTTKEAITEEWKKLNADEKVSVANDPKYSPFWRFLSACVTQPALWIVNFLINFVLPNAFLKDATGPWLKLLAWAVHVEPKTATKTRGFVKFIKENPDDETTISAGLFIASPPINGMVYRLKVLNEQSITAGMAYGLIEVEAEQPGKSYNLGVGYYSVLPEPISGITSVANEVDWISAEGTDDEIDEALRLRCRNQFSAVGQYHHDAAYRADITKFAGINTNYVWFEHGAPRGPGTANAYIMVDNGAPSSELVASVNDYIQTQGHHGHGDGLLCMPMPLEPYDLSVVLCHDSFLTDERIEILCAEAENIIRYAFRDNQDFKDIIRTMPFSRFSFSLLGDKLHGLLPDLRSVTFSESDIKTKIAVATLGNLTIESEVA
ncbi:MAG: baseplate J/gp47 family protein [Desulfotalea sp.]